MSLPASTSLARGGLDDPDAVPRTVFTVGGAMETTGRFELDFHRQRKCQLLLFLRGVAHVRDR